MDYAPIYRCRMCKVEFAGRTIINRNSSYERHIERVLGIIEGQATPETPTVTTHLCQQYDGWGMADYIGTGAAGFERNVRATDSIEAKSDVRDDASWDESTAKIEKLESELAQERQRCAGIVKRYIEERSYDFDTEINIKRDDMLDILKEINAGA